MLWQSAEEARLQRWQGRGKFLGALMDKRKEKETRKGISDTRTEICGVPGKQVDGGGWRMEREANVPTSSSPELLPQLASRPFDVQKWGRHIYPEVVWVRFLEYPSFTSLQTMVIFISNSLLKEEKNHNSLCLNAFICEMSNTYFGIWENKEWRFKFSRNSGNLVLWHGHQGKGMENMCIPST